MFCTQCGTANPDDLMVCTNCSASLVKPGDRPRTQNPNPYPTPGASQQQYSQPSTQPYPGYRSSYSGSQGYQPYPSSYANQISTQQGSASGRSVAAMILSIVSIPTCGPFLSIPGLILGKMEMNAIRDGKAPQAGETFAKIGFYLGVAVTVLYCLLFLVGIALFLFGVTANSGG